MLSSAVFHVKLGCPEGRHLRVKRELDVPLAALPHSCAGLPAVAKSWCHCQTYNGTAFELKSNERLEYNIETYGCPIALPYTRRFSPRLEIWDGDVFVRDVEVDYVLFESNDRNEEFSYMLTMQDAGCLREADTWSKKNLSLRENGWTPANHQTCFEDDGSQTNPDWNTGYEVMNSSNSIRFSASTQDAPLLFVATVVDPDYSFCMLQTRFAVHAYGMPHSQSTTLTIVTALTAIAVASLGASYLWYRHELYAKKTK